MPSSGDTDVDMVVIEEFTCRWIDNPRIDWHCVFCDEPRNTPENDAICFECGNSPNMLSIK